MNKSSVALAVLAAFAGAASAQSSVTLYGRAEVNVTNSKPGDRVNGGNDVWRMDDGGDPSGIGGSRWGLRGSEDLGSGLKANFQLEQGFRTDTGGAGDTARTFNRQSWVGIGSASFGDIRLGRQETISRLINTNYSDVSAIGELKIDEAVGGGRQLFQTFGQRIDNIATYITPNLAGFQAQAMVGAGEGANARYQGGMVTYSGFGLKAALGYEEFDKFGARTSAYNKVLNFGINYNVLNIVTPFFGYQDSKDVGTSAGAALTPTSVQDQQLFTVGALVPLGPVQLRANYTQGEYDLVNGTSGKVKKYGISARYSLSKRTTLYSAITQRDGSTSGAVNNGFNDEFFTQRREITLLGVAHTF